MKKRIETPFADRVPVDTVANLKWRKKVFERVKRDPDFADVIVQACAVDPIFYISGFGWTYDSRLAPFTKLPFILYPYQVKGLLKILQAIQAPGNDILIEKARDTGASWLCILAFEWLWHFSPKLGAPSFIMGSRDATYVDDAENDKALFWKIDYFLRNLPGWLLPKGFNWDVHRHKMKLTNPENGSSITGETTTPNFARGARATAILLDEFAAVDQGHRILPSTLAATRCRIFNSTPQGIGNAYYDVRQTNIEVVRFDWWNHPTKGVGLYRTSSNGSLQVLDKKGYPENYKPILDGILRSPAYDYEEERSSPRQMAQEWNIDYLGSDDQFFKADLIKEVTRKYARQPVVVGDLEYDATTGESIRFYEHPGGKIKLWCLLTKDGKFPTDHKIILGVDVSAGTGNSNSCLSGWDSTTNEKVLEYVNSHIRPEEFAKQSVAIARWLNKAYMIWEFLGPGRQFGSRVLELHYGNVYYRKKEEALSKKTSDVPGFAPTKDSKKVLLGNYRDAVENEKCINRSEPALSETLEYIFSTNGGVEHSRATGRGDPSGTGASHGDRVIADALAWHGLTERKLKPVQEKPEVPIGSLAWRRERLRKKLQPSNRELGAGWG